MAETSFQPNADVTKIAEAYALDAVDIAAKNFDITLDWSENSIERVEQMLAQLHAEMARTQPPEETVKTFCKMFGSYIGQVLLRHHGGEWGVVTMGEESIPGIQYGAGALCWPWGKVRNRLFNGPEDNVWHYYRLLVEESA